jgi:ABC-type Zn uptake system ZnuABC Zn-binding protein ZnuA
MRLSLTATTLVLLTLFPLGCSRKPEHRIGVAATTTLIGSIVSEVGGPAFAPSVVAPAGICPGRLTCGRQIWPG